MSDNCCVLLDYKRSEQRSVKADVKETIQELQECIEVQKKTFTDLQNEYSHYQVVSLSDLKNLGT